MKKIIIIYMSLMIFVGCSSMNSSTNENNLEKHAQQNPKLKPTPANDFQRVFDHISSGKP